MTRFGKCDICRQRKVKCDEQRPTCGQCAKKKRPCQYDYVKVWRFINLNPKLGELSFRIKTPAGNVDKGAAEQPASGGDDQSPVTLIRPTQSTTLSVGWVKEASSGKGTFHTLVPVRSGKAGNAGLVGRGNEGPAEQAIDYFMNLGSPTVRMPTSPDTRLRAKFIYLVGEKPHPFNPTFLWGSWVSMVPGRIGRSAAFNDATASFIAANIARHDMTEPNLAVARSQYNKALQSLRGALAGTYEQRVSNETLAAVKMLTAFERLLGMRNNRWVAHVRGLIQLFIARGPTPEADDMNRSLFYSLLPCELTEALLNGTNSAFDSEAWLDFSPPENQTRCPTIRSAFLVLMQQIILVPRLTRLVRRLKEEESNIELGMEALELAERLYSNNLNGMMDQAVTSKSRWVPTRFGEVVEYFPESIEFPAIEPFDTLIRHSYCRILISGLCQQLREIFPFSPILEAAPLEEEEVRAAEYLAMSVQHAEYLNEPMPLGSFLLGQAILFSYGAWRRLEKTTRAISEYERERAQFMKEWVRGKANEMIKDWDGDEVSREALDMETDAFEGGPVMPWMRREPKMV